MNRSHTADPYTKSGVDAAAQGVRNGSGIIALVTLLLNSFGCAESAFNALEACNQQILGAKTLTEITCHRVGLAAQPEGKYNQQTLQELQQFAAEELDLVRERREVDTATFRFKSRTEPNLTNGGFSVELAKEGGQWLVTQFRVNHISGDDANPEAKAWLHMTHPYRLQTDPVHVQTASSGGSYAYMFTDPWNEISVNIQTEGGPLSAGTISYSYRRETLDPPPVRVIITRGTSDSYSYHHGGEIVLQQDTSGFLSGKFELWAENQEQEQERIEVAGQFTKLKN